MVVGGPVGRVRFTLSTLARELKIPVACISGRDHAVAGAPRDEDEARPAAEVGSRSGTDLQKN